MPDCTRVGLRCKGARFRLTLPLRAAVSPPARFAHETIPAASLLQPSRTESATDATGIQERQRPRARGVERLMRLTILLFLVRWPSQASVLQHVGLASYRTDESGAVESAQTELRV